METALKLSLEHKTALEKVAELGSKKWKSMFTFTIVRNPWDKVVSHYHYRLLKNKTNIKTDAIDFKTWVKKSYGEQDPLYYDFPKMFMPQLNWIADHQGRLLVKKVCRFEHLNRDFYYVCSKLKQQNLTLPHIKASDRGDYRDYYDDETAEIVQRWFKEDIKKFDYQF